MEKVLIPLFQCHSYKEGSWTASTSLDHIHPQLHHTQLSRAPRSQQREKLLYNREACNCLTEHTRATKIAADLLSHQTGISLFHHPAQPPSLPFSCSAFIPAFCYLMLAICVSAHYSVAGNNLQALSRRLTIAVINTIASLHTGHRGQLCLPCTWRCPAPGTARAV